MPNGGGHHVSCLDLWRSPVFIEQRQSTFPGIGPAVSCPVATRGSPTLRISGVFVHPFGFIPYTGFGVFVHPGEGGRP